MAVCYSFAFYLFGAPFPLSDNQATRTMADQRFSTPSDKPGVESTRQLEEQLYSYQCSLEAAIRSLANISSTLLKHSATQGQCHIVLLVAVTTVQIGLQA